MSFWSKFANLITGGSHTDKRSLTIYVLSNRCKEPIAGLVDLYNELSRTEDESDYAYYTRKVLHTSGETRCFDQVEVELWFDRNKQVAHHDVTGGRWLEAEEYQAEMARFHAPPEENQSEDQASG